MWQALSAGLAASHAAVAETLVVYDLGKGARTCQLGVRLCGPGGRAEHELSRARSGRVWAHRQQQRYQRHQGEPAQVRAACRLGLHGRHVARAGARPVARGRALKSEAHGAAHAAPARRKRARKPARVASGQREAEPTGSLIGPEANGRASSSQL